MLEIIMWMEDYVYLFARSGKKVGSYINPIVVDAILKSYTFDSEVKSTT